MHEEWLPIQGFPGYEVSNLGGVHKENCRPPTQSPVQYNIPTVGLRLDGDPKVYRRSVPVLVANAFLPEPEREDFDTPIQLDGNRANARADNLMWRPRWFAVHFHKQLVRSKFPDWSERVLLIETGEVFPDIHEPARKYGLLETSIVKCLKDPSDWVWPYEYHFVLADL